MGVVSMFEVRPSSDLRNHYAEVSREVRETRVPTVLTVNGRSDTVIMGFEDYQRMMARFDLLNTLVDAEEDAAAHRVAPMNTSLAALRAELGGTQTKAMG